MQIVCVDSEAGIGSIAGEWTALWRRVPDATPFQSPSWLLAWWRHFAAGTAQILTAGSAGALVGVLPLYRRREGKLVKLLPIGIGLSDYIDALTDRRCTGVADALLAAAADLPAWTECHLPDLPAGAALTAARCPPGLEEGGGPSVPCPVLALPPARDELGRVVPRKTLRDLRQAGSRAAARGPVEIDRAEGDEIDRTMAELFRLHEKRWRHRGENGVVADPAVRAFHRGAARALGAAGMLRLYRLAVEGEVMAVYYGFAHGGRAYAYLGGFDPDEKQLSPGALIMRHAIEAAIGEGASEFHFLRGGETYKYAWGARDRWSTARTLRRQ